MAIFSLGLALTLLAALLVAWLARFRVADTIIAGKLAATEVPVSYRISRIGPFLERMENVRIGDPAAPDLVARRIDVTIGYGFTGPVVRRILVDGVRLRGVYDAQGLHFGALDRLLPKTSGKAGLPDIPLAINDATLGLATPAGAVSAAISGEGNPAGRFQGDVSLVALSLRAGGCVARDVAAELKIASRAGKPEANGPVRLNGLTCPAQQLALGQSVAQIAVASDAGFERLTLEANLAGAAGRIRQIRFASFDGAIAGSRSSSGSGARVKLGLGSASAPALSRIVGRSAHSAAGTPLDPVATRAISALARMLAQADASADLTIASRADQTPEVRFHHLALVGADGARLAATEQAGLTWTQDGVRTDADFAMSGGSLPALAIRVHQAAAGASLTGIATMRPYRAGAAMLAATPLRFGWDGRRADFATRLTIDGPVADGFVRGLSVPVTGHATRAGAFVVGETCETVAFRQLRLISFVFDAARIPLCGRPIIARTSAGAMRIDATTGPIRLAGHTRDGAPVALTASGMRFTQASFTARDLTTTLGGSEQSTRLSIAVLDGHIGRTIGGNFSNAGGRIANVPLDISGAAGSWALAGGALRLNGKLKISDSDPAARFRPLVSADALLSLEAGRITATATLREPTTQTALATVDLAHDLARGTGRALLDVPGLAFAPKRFQPEQVTPLTLGVIANVAGTISGQGRIDWNPQGVTSVGEFGTERIDLAAAFGPVTGIRGRLRFTDLLGLVTAPHQEATIAEVNPGVSVTNGVVRYQLTGASRVRVEDAHWPFAGGDLRLDPGTLDFGGEAERRLTFRIGGLDAAAFVQQLDFPNISATGTFDGVLPMIFDQSGGRIEQGSIVARSSGGTLAYVGELSNAQLGTMGKLAFDALKAIRYSSLDISLDGRLDGEMVSRVRFTGVREATPDQSLATRLIRNLPFRFNISIRAPFRGLVGSARAYIDPRLLLTQARGPTKQTRAEPAIQPPASGNMR